MLENQENKKVPPEHLLNFSKENQFYYIGNIPIKKVRNSNEEKKF